MSSNIEKLLIVQDRDRRIRQLKQEQEDIPKRRALAETRLAESKQASHDAQEALKRNAAAIKATELEIDTARDRIGKYRVQQNQIKTNEEYRAIDREIAGVEKQIREFEDREIVLMEETEGLRAQVAAAEARLKQQDAVVQSDRDALDVRLKQIAAEAKQLLDSRPVLLEGIDPDWLSRYERTFANKAGIAIVPLEAGSCGGCHMVLPPQLVQDARRPDRMACCSFCGRVLYSSR